MRSNWLYIAVIAVLVAIALALWETPPQSLLSNDEDADDAPQPYAVIEEAHSRHFDKEGQLSYEFVARNLYHFRQDLTKVSEDDFTTLDFPKLTLYAEDKLWYATAEKGRLTESGQVLTLRGNVRIWRPQEGNEMELNTSKLIVRPHQKVVETDAEVKLLSPQGELQAIGMEVDLNSQKMQLKQAVRGFHEPI